MKLENWNITESELSHSRKLKQRDHKLSSKRKEKRIKYTIIGKKRKHPLQVYIECKETRVLEKVAFFLIE